MLKVEIKDRKMRRFTREMPKAAQRSMMRALNKTLTKSRTRAAREVSQKRNVKVGRARSDMKLNRASMGRLEASIEARGKPIKVMEVVGPKRQTKRGVTAKLEKGQKPHLFEGAFIARTAQGHIGVFRRRGSGRLPIIEATLPSVASTMIQDRVTDQLDRFAQPVYEAELVRLLLLEMARAGAR